MSTDLSQMVTVAPPILSPLTSSCPLVACRASRAVCRAAIRPAISVSPVCTPPRARLRFDFAIAAVVHRCSSSVHACNSALCPAEDNATIVSQAPTRRLIRRPSPASLLLTIARNGYLRNRRFELLNAATETSLQTRTSACFLQQHYFVHLIRSRLSCRRRAARSQHCSCSPLRRLRSAKPGVCSPALPRPPSAYHPTTPRSSSSSSSKSRAIPVQASGRAARRPARRCPAGRKQLLATASAGLQTRSSLPRPRRRPGPSTCASPRSRRSPRACGLRTAAR